MCRQGYLLILSMKHFAAPIQVLKGVFPRVSSSSFIKSNSWGFSTVTAAEPHVCCELTYTNYFHCDGILRSSNYVEITEIIYMQDHLCDSSLLLLSFLDHQCLSSYFIPLLVKGLLLITSYFFYVELFLFIPGLFFSSFLFYPSCD